MPDKTEIAYFAGFFDGEGMVAVYDASSTYVVVLANTDTRPLMRAQEIWGGRIFCQMRAGTRYAKQDFWRWQVYGHNARQFLEDVRPYLILKAEQVDVFLGVLEHIPSRRGKKRKEGATAAIQQAEQRLRLLKRGVA
jgi:hypothetical protein